MIFSLSFAANVSRSLLISREDNIASTYEFVAAVSNTTSLICLEGSVDDYVVILAQKSVYINTERLICKIEIELFLWTSLIFL